MAANEHHLCAWLPLTPFCTASFAGGCLGNQEKGLRVRREGKQKEKGTQQEAVTPHTSQALRLESLRFNTDRSKKKCCSVGGYRFKVLWYTHMHEWLCFTCDSKTILALISLHIHGIAIVWWFIKCFLFLSLYLSATGIWSQRTCC